MKSIITDIEGYLLEYKEDLVRFALDEFNHTEYTVEMFMVRGYPL